MKTDAQSDSTAHPCCGGHHHDHAISVAAAETAQPRKKYFCPMCEGLESNMSGSCSKCGMTLERNPAVFEPREIIYTCPMHPQIQQNRPGNCPICGMTLEPKTIGMGDEEE